MVFKKIGLGLSLERWSWSCLEKLGGLGLVT